MYNMKKEEDKFVIEDDNKIIGRILYEYNGNSIAVLSTFVDPNYRGKNLARLLVDEVVKLARGEHKQIIPVCSYVLKLFEKNPEEFHDVWNKVKHDYDQACKLQ